MTDHIAEDMIVPSIATLLTGLRETMVEGDDPSTADLEGEPEW